MWNGHEQMEGGMATVINQSELLRRAVVWLDARRQERPDAPLMDLLEETGMRFNLGPLDAANLERLFREKLGG